jgi:hypothetical protein
MPNIPPTTTSDPVAQYKNFLKRIEQDEKRERLEREAEKEAMEAAAEKAAIDGDIAATKKAMEAADTKLREEVLKAPKRNNPYMNFSTSKREQIMREDPEMKPTMVSRIIGAMWKDMTPEEKYKFSDEHALKVREGELAGLFGGKKRRKTRRRAAKKTSKKHGRRRTTRKH